jgi:GNAT superfamily N-acetyltransferase
MQRTQRTQPSRSAASTAKAKPKPRLKVRRETTVAAGKQGGSGGRAGVNARGQGPSGKHTEPSGPTGSAVSVAPLRVAEGTQQEAEPTAKPGKKTVSAADGKADVPRLKSDVTTTHAVESVDIRPSGTVISRRPLRGGRRPAILHLPLHPVIPSAPPAWMLEECHVAPARAGDQSEILQLLAALPAPPSRAEFHASVDHPEHDSANRLVARLAGRIVGHAEIVPRDLAVGSATIRGAVIDRVAVLPECRGAGHGQRLVRAAEERMRASGAVVAFSRTRIAASFRELGWSVLGRDCVTPGRPTEILSRLLDGPQRVGEAVTMRQWRHVELPAILRIYRQNATRFVGPVDRNENYARWLVSRGAFDSILVALTGQDRYELHESSARIVGYCVQAGSRVLEILADPEFPGLEREILARVCAEAIENDRQEITYESSSADPLHEAVAGGASLVQGGDRMIVARVFRPQPLLEALAPQVAARVAELSLREAVELGLDSPSFRGSIIVPERKGGPPEATVHPGRVGRSYLRLSDEELARLLLGQCDPAEAVAAGRMEPSTQLAQKLAGQLFPRQSLWCPLWDDLPA